MKVVKHHLECLRASVFAGRGGGEVMAGGRRTSFSGVFITTVLAVMLLPGERTCQISVGCSLKYLNTGFHDAEVLRSSADVNAAKPPCKSNQCRKCLKSLIYCWVIQRFSISSGVEITHFSFTVLL